MAASAVLRPCARPLPAEPYEGVQCSFALQSRVRPARYSASKRGAPNLKGTCTSKCSYFKIFTQLLNETSVVSPHHLKQCFRPKNFNHKLIHLLGFPAGLVRPSSSHLTSIPMGKSLLVAYLCWFTGGLVGLHHFYLGRDDHAFITFATFGGYFTLGLIRDLWRLPEYVKDANNDPQYLDWLHEQIKLHKKPPSSIVRQSGVMMVGNLMAFLVEYAIPKDYLAEQTLLVVRFLLVPFASAFGVWLAGNVGRHKGSIDKPLIASFLAASVALVLNVRQFGSFSTLAALMVFNRSSKEWRMRPSREKPFIKRLLVFILCIALYTSLWTSWLYFNCEIEDPETEKPIKCRKAIENFFRSSAYTNLAEATWILVEHVRHQGVSGLWKEIMSEFDMTGRNTALATLGLPDGASQQEILAQYKKLSRELHPDRERDEAKKLEKHEKFIQVQEAFRTLKSRVQ